MKEKSGNTRKVNRAVILCATSFLIGCATIPDDLGRDDVDEMVYAGTSLDPMDRSIDLSTILKSNLSVDTSVRIALSNNPQLRSKMAELGFGAADVYQAARIRNPVFSASVFDSTESGARKQITFGVVASFTDLLTLRKRTRLAKAEFAALRQHVAHEALVVVKETRSAYYEYAAAREIATLRAHAAHSADVSYRLAKRFFKAGNITSRELSIAEANAAEAKLTSLSADANGAETRAKFAGMLGLDASLNWQLDSGMSVPVTAVSSYEELLAQAQNARLDLRAAKTEVDQVAQEHGMTQWARWIDDFELGYERERETDGERLRGPTLDWAIPLISQNRDQLLRVQARFQQSIAALEETSVRISNEVWLAHQGLLNAAERLNLLTFRLVPARLQATLRAQEEEAYMLVGVFDVLDSKQQEFDAFENYIDSLKDYWIAHAELSYAVGTQVKGVRSDEVFKFSNQLNDATGTHQHHHDHGASAPPAPTEHQHHGQHK